MKRQRVRQSSPLSKWLLCHFLSLSRPNPIFGDAVHSEDAARECARLPVAFGCEVSVRSLLCKHGYDAGRLDCGASALACRERACGFEECGGVFG